MAFVRYAGPRLESDQHLLTALKIVGLLAKRPGHLVVDMSTRKVLSSSEWSAWSQESGFLSEQVQPGIEEGPDGVTIFTRGMVKFGLPDLEAYGLRKADARGFFEKFQTVLSQLMTREKVRWRDLNGIQLLACQRDDRAIEGQCVRLPTPE